MNMFQFLMMAQQNPLDVLKKGFNIPDGINTPDAVARHLLDTKQITQEQINNVMQMKNNPFFGQFFRK